MVPWRHFNINGTFPLHKKLSRVEKGSLDFLNVLHTKKKKAYNKMFFGELKMVLLWNPLLLSSKFVYESVD